MKWLKRAFIVVNIIGFCYGYWLGITQLKSYLDNQRFEEAFK